VVAATCGPAEPGQYAFEGCYAYNHKDDITVWTDEPTSWADCRDLARFRASGFFVFSLPDDDAWAADKDAANCGISGAYALEGAIEAQACDTAVDSNGHPLGGPTSLAVFTLAAPLASAAPTE